MPLIYFCIEKYKGLTFGFASDHSNSSRRCSHGCLCCDCYFSGHNTIISNEDFYVNTKITVDFFIRGVYHSNITIKQG